ncbi:MAG: hypothetical protein U0167_11100 [bacterium]
MSSAGRWLRPIRCALSAAALAVAAGGPAARAGDVPVSALSIALQSAPELVDSPAQALLHPQRTADGPGRIVSFDEGSATGVVLSPGGRFAVSAFAQGYQPDPVYYSPNLRTLQAGLAGCIGAVRLGAAYRDQRSKHEETDEQLDLTTGEPAHNNRHTRQSTKEFAAGIGFARGRGSANLTAEIERFERNADGDQDDHYDTTAFSVDVLGRRRWGGAFLVAAPLGARNLLRFAGAFRDRRADLHLVRHDLLYQRLDYRNALYGHEWNAGLAFERDLADSAGWRVHAFYSDARDPGRPEGYSYPQIEMTRHEYAEVGASFQRPGWWGETQYFGVRASREKETDERTSFDRDRIERRATYDESQGHSFAWGASRSFGDLDLVGQVGSSLNLSSFFSSIDATLRF